MKSKKIFLSWLNEYKEFCPTGLLFDENIRYTPKQGYGVCEIAAWLGNDIQYSINSVNIWINNLTDLEHSRAPDGMFGIGNAHWVLITGDYVFIGTEYVEEQQVIMTREQLLYVLEQYKTFLEGDYKDPNNPPGPIDVEFIAEGQEAIDIYNGLPNSHLVPYAC
ncbi:hypothetical protein [Gilliamella sp. ESL0254]|uniref:hypothetical protein n=1 Tax=Gilliamella sp. ESL0254 TaxID=2705035 RepID=UPI001580A482|nr:hypothetical protein [Gilliamella sp. ESL0254]NUF26968.1 DUF5376 domain-containing protein [Gilliamella sp. ESL0254]